jgi:hypothetical protein
MQLAGLGLDVDAAGSEWRVPERVRAENGALRWQVGEATAAPTHQAPVRDFLTPFAALATHPDLDKAVEKFSSRWGVLGLCEHGLPATHQPLRLGVEGLRSTATCEPRIEDGWGIEPLDRWRHFAGQAAAFMRAAAALSARTVRRVDDKDWEALKPLFPPGMEMVLASERTSRGGEGRQSRKRLLVELPQSGVVERLNVQIPTTSEGKLAYAMRRWLELGDVRILFDWRGTAGLGYAARSLFGALGLRLALVISKNRSIKVCGYCTTPYVPVARERAVTQCCSSEACKRARIAANQSRKRAGNALPRPVDGGGSRSMQ